MSTLLTGPRVAGDVIIESAIITNPAGTNIDITNLVGGVQIFESVNSPFMTGVVDIADSVNLIDSVPLMGEEYLFLTMSTPGIKDKFARQFFVYKLIDYTKVSDRNYAYSLCIVSIAGFVDFNKRLSHRFNGLISDIAKTLISDPQLGLQYSGNLLVQDTSNRLSFVSNFWSPSRCLQYCADHALDINSVPSYVFYETHQTVNFVSLDALYQNEIAQVFVQDHLQGNDKDVNLLYQRIIELNVPTAFNYLDRLQGGYIKSKQYTFDLISKNAQITEYDMIADFPNLKHLNKYALNTNGLSSMEVAAMTRRVKHYDEFDHGGDTSNAASAQRRASAMVAAESSKIEITVAGRMDYVAGMVVAVAIHKNQATAKGDGDTLNYTLSGKYLVNSINHYVNHGSHHCIMSLSKDSTLREVEKVNQ